MAQFKQRSLAGPGLQGRKEASRKVGQIFGKIMKGESVDLESPDMRSFLTLQFEDILKERRRIGGDWVVAGALKSKQIRQFARWSLQHITHHPTTTLPTQSLS